jgi:hypothetical protein
MVNGTADADGKGRGRSFRHRSPRSREGPDPLSRGQGMLVGYARVSTQEQDLAPQLDALGAAGCGRVFEAKASGAQRDRPALKAALGSMRASDTLVVWKLDRLAHSLKQLVETVEDLGAQNFGLRSLTVQRGAPVRPARLPRPGARGVRARLRQAAPTSLAGRGRETRYPPTFTPDHPIRADQF